MKSETESIAKSVSKKVNNIAPGYVFTYSEIIGEPNKAEATIKALNRLVFSGRLKKISRGRFYIPEKSPFGELDPSEYQIAKDLLEKDNRPIGYLTGLSIYSKLGLTTQIGNIIQIGRNSVRPPLTRGKYKITFVLQKNNIKKENIPLLQLLDAIKYFNKIPDSDIKFVINRFKTLISEMSTNRLKHFVNLLLKYPAKTRALTGAILEETGNNNFMDIIKSTLNPITIYKLGLTKEVLSTAENWNIK